MHAQHVMVLVKTNSRHGFSCSDKDKSLNEGAIEPWEPTSSDFYPTLLKRVCEVYKINMDKPYKS